MTVRRKLLIDTDAGTDDAQAIQMALSDPTVDVVGITTVHGNTDNEQVALNVLRLLKVVGRMDIPVYMGSNTSLMGHKIQATHYHGLDGFGDVPDPEAPGLEHAQSEHAVTAMLRLAREHEGELSLVCLAPLTNVALALRMEPDFSSRLKDCFIMGGNFHGKGNSSPAAEFNFFSDPESADICLRELTCPLTMACWELCLKSTFQWAWYEKFLSHNSKLTKFFKKIESKTLATFYRDQNPDLPYEPADQVLMAAILDDDVITERRQVHMRVEVTGARTRGQSVVDWRNTEDLNVNLIMGIEQEKFGKMLERAIHGEKIELHSSRG